MLRQYKLSDYRFRLIIWVVALASLGIMIIGSANQEYQSKQTWGLVLGVVLMIVISLFDYTWILNFYWFIYLFGAILLGIVLVAGTNVNGATRWISIGGFRFQPSDMVKIMMILFFAKFFEVREDNINKLRTILFSILLIGFLLMMIEAEPDLSTTIVTALVFCVIIFMAGLSYKIVLGILVVCIPVAVIFMSILMQPDQTIIESYQLTRVYLCGSGRGAWFHRLLSHHCTGISHCTGMHHDRKEGEGSLRHADLLRYGRVDFFPKFC